MRSTLLSCAAILVILSFTFPPVQARDGSDEIDFSRIVFVVDTSASMQHKQANLKVRQAIATWVKYLAPPNVSVGMVELQQERSAHMARPDEELEDLLRVLPERASGAPCLQCGLQYASELLGNATSEDLVVLLVEEASSSSPHDTPQFALDELHPRFRIFTIALTENAMENLEDLAEATNGTSDFIREISYSRLVQSFTLISVVKDYALLAGEECGENTTACQLSFEVDERRDEQATLRLLACPSLTPPSTADREAAVTANLTLTLRWDGQLRCWEAEQPAPPSGVWQFDGSQGESLVAVLQRPGPLYPELRCSSSSSEEQSTARASVTSLTSEIQLTARADSDQAGEPREIELTEDGENEFTACLPYAEGRLSVTCRAVRDGITLLVSQAPSLKLTGSSSNDTLCPQREDVDSEIANLEELQELTNNGTDGTEDWPAYNSTDPSQENATDVPPAPTESRAKSPDVQTEPPKTRAELNGAQITIIVVGSILVVETLFVIYKCRAKKSVDKKKGDKLIPYTVNYRDEAALHLNSYRDNDD